MNREDIKKILPHRDAMLLLDEVTREGEFATGHYTVTGDEYFLKGHFPGNPIVPGVILCEIMAQTTCILLEEELLAGGLPVYTGLDKVKFRSPVKPGETIETKCIIKKKKPPFYFAEGTVSVGDRVCVSAQFSCAIIGD